MIWNPSLYFLCGFLPWEDVGKDILALKQEIISHDIFRKLPDEFGTFLKACHSLAFHNKPNYDQYYNLFNNLLLQQGFDRGTQILDWEVA